MNFLPRICDIELYSYQREIAERIFFSLLIGDADEITVECSRQSGKSEVLADVAVAAMVLFPKLAQAYPDDSVISKFKNGIMIGVFGPIDFQAENIYSRIKMRLESEHAKVVLADPDIQDVVLSPGKTIRLKNSKSFCRMQTANPKAKIESSTYHLIILDEAQEADSLTVRKSLHPMLTATAGSIVKVGTPAPYKSDYYEAIQRNRLRQPTNGKRNHFRYDWRRAAKENPYYAQAIEKEKDRLGEESDEYKMAYEVVWMLERGMLITDEQIDELGDNRMPVVASYTETPVVAGIDLARVHDSTVVTILWVDWDHPDEFGLYNHRVLDWLELHGENWESQYRQICDFLSHYHVMRLGVDSNGMGDPVTERLQVLMPTIEVVPMSMAPIDQSERWQHLIQLFQRRLIRWPAHPQTRRTMKWKRFIQQLKEVEREYKGDRRYLSIGAPRNERNAHDDFVDSLAIACHLTKEFGQITEVEQWSSNPFLERSSATRRRDVAQR